MNLNLEGGTKSVLSERNRKLAAAAVTILCLATIVTAGLSIRDRAQHDRETSAQLRATELAAVEDRYRASVQHFEDRLTNLRLEIRAQGIWNQYGLRPEPAPVARIAEAVADSSQHRVETFEASQLRRLDRLLSEKFGAIRHGLRLELIVASHEGLWARRFERAKQSDDDEARAARLVEPENVGESAAQALWYQDTVQRAVAASGRHLDWGADAPQADDGQGPNPQEQRLAIAIHEADDVIQAALVLVIDTASWAAVLENPKNDRMYIRVTDTNGSAWSKRPAPDWFSSGGAVEARLEAPLRADSQTEAVARVLVSNAPGVANGGAAGAGSLVLGLFLLGVFGGLFSYRLVVPPVRVTRYEIAGPAEAALSSADPAEPTETTASDTSDASNAAETSEALAPRPDREEIAAVLTASPRKIVLRDWLADVRTCLERKAAMQGLGLEVACEHALPEAVETDPVALGAILVSLGQEALAATPNEKIRLVVRSDGNQRDALRFDIEGGGVDLPLSAPTTMLLEQLGGRRDPSDSSDLSLVVSA